METEKAPCKEDERINAIMRHRKFNPNNLIFDAESKTLDGWRKTIQWTDASGKTFKLTTGEGTIFEDSEDDKEEAKESSYKPDTKIESKVQLDVMSGTGSTVDPAVLSPPSVEIDRL